MAKRMSIGQRVKARTVLTQPNKSREEVSTHAKRHDIKEAKLQSVEPASSYEGKESWPIPIEKPAKVTHYLWPEILEDLELLQLKFKRATRMHISKSDLVNVALEVFNENTKDDRTQSKYLSRVEAIVQRKKHLWKTQQ